jgi:hypothetical protein
VKRTALTLGCLLLLAATSGCNEDPRPGAFTVDAGTEDTSPPSEAEKWYQTACETTSPREISVEENTDGNWAYALPRSASEYRNLQLSGFEAPHAAAVVETSLNGVAGALMSRPVDFAENNGPDGVMRNQSESFPDPVAEKIFATNQGAYDTQGGRRATNGRFLLKTDVPMTVDAFRNLMLVHFADFDRSDVEGLGGDDGEKHSQFRVFVTLQTMPTPGTDRNHGVYSIAVSAAQAYDENEEVRQAMEDLSLSNNLAPAGTSRRDDCDKYSVPIGTRQYTYLVIDVDGPEGYSKDVNRFFSKISEAAFARGVPPLVRLGVTNTVMANEGRFVHDGWLNNKEEFLQAVKDAATECKPTDDWACEGERDGLGVAKKGLEYMSNQENPPPKDVRMVPDSLSAVGIISDEKPHTIESGERTAEYYRDWFGRKIGQIVGPKGQCSAKKRLAQAYIDISSENGYTYLDDYCELRDELDTNNTAVQNFWRAVPIDQTTTHSSQLSLTPLTPSLRAVLNAEDVPRSRENGFAYFANANTAGLYGSYSGNKLDPFAGPYFVAFRYWSWDDGSEE